MLHTLVGNIQDTGIDIRWLVMAGDRDFFRVTKRIHNRLHGVAGDLGDLGPDESALFQRVTDSNVASLIGGSGHMVMCSCGKAIPSQEPCSGHPSSGSSNTRGPAGVE